MCFTLSECIWKEVGVVMLGLKGVWSEKGLGCAVVVTDVVHLKKEQFFSRQIEAVLPVLTSPPVQWPVSVV